MGSGLCYVLKHMRNQGFTTTYIQVHWQAIYSIGMLEPRTSQSTIVLEVLWHKRPSLHDLLQCKAQESQHRHMAAHQADDLFSVNRQPSKWVQRDVVKLIVIALGQHTLSWAMLKSVAIDAADPVLRNVVTDLRLPSTNSQCILTARCTKGIA